MTTDTRIAELLRWESMGSNDCRWWTKEQDIVVADFTTDLNLTVREIERKGWNWSCYHNPELGINGAWIGQDEVYSKEYTPAEALALAFLAALEAEKEGE